MGASGDPSAWETEEDEEARHRNLVGASAVGGLSYLEAPSVGQTVLWEACPWGEGAFLVEALCAGWHREAQVGEVPCPEEQGEA